MAFSFTVETGLADPDANSYASVDCANNYIGTKTSTDWDALDDATKKRHLVSATHYIAVAADWNRV